MLTQYVANAVPRLGDVRIRNVRVRNPRYVDLVAALVVVWGVGDVASTLFAWASTGSAGMEGNPLIRTILVHEPLLLLVVKAAVVLVVGGTLLRYREFVTSVPLWRAWLVSVLALGTTIVLTNVYVGVLALV